MDIIKKLCSLEHVETINLTPLMDFRRPGAFQDIRTSCGFCFNVGPHSHETVTHGTTALSKMGHRGTQDPINPLEGTGAGVLIEFDKQFDCFFQEKFGGWGLHQRQIV